MTRNGYENGDEEVGCAFSQTRTLAIGLTIGCAWWLVALIGCLVMVAGFLMQPRPW